MADETSTPAGTEEVKTEVINTNSNQETGAQTQTEAKPEVDLHGFTSDQLGELAKFMKGQGGFEAFKARMSNPDKYAQPEHKQEAQSQTQQTQQTQAPAEQTQTQQVRQTPPDGYATVQELSVERYFKDLAHEAKYASISKEIEDGSFIKEMESMGMHPIDGDYNININQVRRFLELKAASVPIKQTSAEPTNTPIVEYVNEGGEITDRNTAYNILRQSYELTQKGLPPHPDAEKARVFLHGK